MNWLTQPEALALLFLLSTMEIVLSVDNHAMVTTMTDRLDEDRRKVVHAFSFGGTLIFRTLLLVWLCKLMQSHTLAITLFEERIEARQMVLILGGAFLIIKSLMEITAHVMQKQVNPPEPISMKCLTMTAQIIIIDVILSIDSMMAALAVANDFKIIISALIVAQMVMMIFGHKIQELLNSAPTLETLALVVLHAVGWISVLEGAGVRVSEGYLFAAAAFATVVEVVNLKLLKNMPQEQRNKSRGQQNYSGGQQSTSTRRDRNNKSKSGRVKASGRPRSEQLPLTR